MQHHHAYAWRSAGVLALCSLVLAAPAPGQTPPASGGGGVTYVATPKLTTVSCLKGCASRKRPRGGSTIVIRGSALGGASEVWFLGSRGRSDDASVPVRAGSDSRLRAQVPLGAVSGPIAVAGADGSRSAASPPVPILPAPPPAPGAELSPVPGFSATAGSTLETGTSRTKAYVGARRAVTFSFRLSGPAPAALTVELFRASDGVAVKSWTPTDVVPGQLASVSWDGRIGKATATPGRYSFRLTAAAPDGTQATSAQTGDVERDAFDLFDHIFPVRGKHDYGGSGARFGTGRSGHSHQGHDVFAKCGVPMVAARGGRVQYSGYHGAAGNYMVIDGAGTDVDYAYMHMEQASPFGEGDRVYTGQSIGAVGETGNARGCHLHFEMWDAPGWYDGGDPFDPLPSLKAWDGWS